MKRDSEFMISGYRVLRFPAHAVPSEPDRVARQIQHALGLGSSPG
jgi:very-short-patch-repair endonuclease